jgi:hypothetical protein
MIRRSGGRPIMRKKTSISKAKGKKNRPKIKLGIPDLEDSKAAVLRSLGSPDSRRGYQHAIDEFVAWYCSEPRLAFNKTVVLRYRFHLEEQGLAPGTINVRLVAVRRLAYEAADAGLLSLELAARIHRVKGVRKLGSRWATGLRRMGRRRSGSYPITRLLLENAIARFWPPCAVAGCAAASLRN